MKKSILFSSIAATCCLLIQHSASAEWTNFSGEIALSTYMGKYGTTGITSISTSNLANNWTSAIVSSSGQVNLKSCSTSWTANSFSANSQSSGLPWEEYNVGNASVAGKLYFSVTHESIITLGLNFGGADIVSVGGTASLETITSGLHTNIARLSLSHSPGAWREPNGDYVTKFSDSCSIIIMPNIEYEISINLLSDGNNGGAYCSFGMSLTPVPAPAASALLALAGLVSRRRRA